MSSRKRLPWLDSPFTFRSFFSYATGVAAGPARSAAGKKPPPKDKKPPKPDDKERPGPVTTMAVGEEGQGGGVPGPTTPAMGEEGVGNVPTTTIAKGEEAGS